MRGKSKLAQEVLVGMGGWQLASFDDVFYPSSPPRGFRKLAYYSQFLDIVEVNATFYTTSLTPQNARRWLEDVTHNNRFVFTVKLYRGFTHEFTASTKDVRSVRLLLEPLAANKKLGGLIIQFPYSFAYDKTRREYLVKLAQAFRPHRLFLEVRHDSWSSEENIKFFRDHQLHLVNVDLPRIKRHVKLTSTAWDDIAYFRMMGRNAATWDRSFIADSGIERGVNDRYRYRYSEDELGRLLSLIEQVRPAASRVFVVFHNDPDANSLVNGFQMRHLLKPKEKFRVPHTLAKKFPEIAQFSLPVPTAVPTASEPSLFDEAQ